MSYDYFDSRGFVAPGPSYTGQWAPRSHPAPHTGRIPSIAHYLERSFTARPRQLVSDLCRLSLPADPVNVTRLRLLSAAARRAGAILVLSDGC
jgi:hypothetical protein